VGRVYDITARIKAETMGKLTSIITRKIEKIGRVNAKLTMIITETPMPLAHQNAIFLEIAFPVQNA
jgi:DNA-binding Lrp family transcriptional regulator